MIIKLILKTILFFVSLQIFYGNGTKASVDMLKARCVEFTFDQPLVSVTIELWGPDGKISKTLKK
jgi:hypothetical protein